MIATTPTKQDTVSPNHFTCTRVQLCTIVLVSKRLLPAHQPLIAQPTPQLAPHPSVVLQLQPHPAVRPPGQPLLPLAFYKRRKGWDQVSYNGYTYDRATRRGRRPTVQSPMRIFGHIARYEQPHLLYQYIMFVFCGILCTYYIIKMMFLNISVFSLTKVNSAKLHRIS